MIFKILDFGKGLFDEKFDMDLSEEESNYQIKSFKNSFDRKESLNLSLSMEKEFLINEAFFNPIPEEDFLFLN
jgi:hypothetical protein